MVILLWVAGGIMIGAMMAFMAYASAVGGVGALTDSRYERCPRCGHHGLVHTGQLHDRSCPPRTGAQAASLLHRGHRLHLGHH